MKGIVFNSEQKEILLEFLKRRFETLFDRSIYHQMYKTFKENDKHFFTSTWSMYCACVINDGYHIFQNESKLLEDYELQILLGRSATKPKLSKRFELWKDLNERIRIPWDENTTYQIIFK